MGHAAANTAHPVCSYEYRYEYRTRSPSLQFLFSGFCCMMVTLVFYSGHQDFRRGLGIRSGNLGTVPVWLIRYIVGRLLSFPV